MVKKSKFFKVKRNFRMDEEHGKMIQSLLKTFPGKYTNESHIIRCAIIKLYNSEIDDLNEGKKNGSTDWRKDQTNES